MHFDTLQGWLSWQETLHPLAIDLGLDRVEAVYSKLNPQRTKPVTVTVAGTNGKGSCVAYLEAIYRQQGYRVGAYTSPHILKYNERIKINGEQVSDDLICEAFSRIEAVRGDISLSYFEFGTLAALDIFSRSGLDIQILEVGLGGRLDAVNIVDADAAIIASIGIDHINWLGNNRESIGREKAGVFRPHTPAIVGDPQPPESVLAVIAEKQADALLIDKDFSYQQEQGYWQWIGQGQQLVQLPEPSLKGEHQYRNAASALCAIMQLQSHLPVSETAIKSGLMQTQLPGRFQLITNQGIPVLLDVGHNPEAISTLAEYLQTHFPNRKIHAVFSMMKDKDIAGVVEIISPLIEDWYFVPLNNPRAASEDLMREIFLQTSTLKVSFGFNGFAEAFQAAKKRAQPEDLLLVFGSFFLISECLHEFEQGELTK
ncbi:bifunctional tetrahydrofolate synthase/dihydrofolate synthase [Methylosoma difficile]